jgi:hypothetical protein
MNSTDMFPGDSMSSSSVSDVNAPVVKFQSVNNRPVSLQARPFDQEQLSTRACNVISVQWPSVGGSSFEREL